MAEGNDRTKLTGGRCAICGKPSVVAYRPFCSARCRDVDLARWLGGGYVIAGSTSDIADETLLPSDGDRERSPDVAERTGGERET